jgi:hypothetical protein
MRTETTAKKPRDPLSEQWIDLRLIAGMRVVLATAALLVVLIEPINGRWAGPTHAALILYSLYSLVVYHLSTQRNPVVAKRSIPWLDLLWYLPLIAFTSNTNSIFYYFFFFSIIVASFSWGLNDGLRLTLASAATYTIVGLVTAPGGQPIDMNRLLLAPIGLLIFGYIIARWGGYHTQLKNRLKLLRDVTVFSNPRFGIDRTIKAILESVRDFYDAEACLLVIPGKPGDEESYQLYRVVRGVSAGRLGRHARRRQARPHDPRRAHDLLHRQRPRGGDRLSEERQCRGDAGAGRRRLRGDRGGADGRPLRAR